MLNAVQIDYPDMTSRFKYRSNNRPPAVVGGVEIDPDLFEWPADAASARAAAGVSSSSAPSALPEHGENAVQCPETVLDFREPRKFQSTFERELLPKLQMSAAVDFQKELRGLLASGDILPKYAYMLKGITLTHHYDSSLRLITMKATSSQSMQYDPTPFP